MEQVCLSRSRAAAYRDRAANRRTMPALRCPPWGSGAAILATRPAYHLYCCRDDTFGARGGDRSPGAAPDSPGIVAPTGRDRAERRDPDELRIPGNLYDNE